MRYLLFVTVLFSISSMFSQDDGSVKTDSLLIQQLDSLMIKWHKSASDSDWKSYSDFLDSEFVFLGTDPEERWQGKEFSDFAQPYFAQGKGWDFTTNSRHWYFSHDKSTAWFEEEIDTWMKNCRGTGVLMRTDKSDWKLVHYSLSVLIENDKIQPFIKLRGE